MIIIDILITIYVLLKYFLAGYNKVFNFNNTYKNIQNNVFSILPKNNSKLLSTLTLIIVIVLEITAPLMVLYTVSTKSMKKESLLALKLLGGFTILAILIYHRPTIPKNFNNFIGHLGMLGGIMALHEYIRINPNII